MPPSARRPRRPSLRPLALALGLVTGLACVGLQLAPDAARAEEGGTLLAPPGACAEPREALAGGGSDFSVAGPLSDRFTPADVAAPPPGDPAPPVVAATVRPGPCDVPGAGCAPLVGQMGTDPPVKPGPRPEPEPQPVRPKSGGAFHPPGRPTPPKDPDFFRTKPGLRRGHLDGDKHDHDG